MQRFRWLNLFVIFMFLAFNAPAPTGASAQAETPNPRQLPPTEFVPGELVVGLKETVQLAQVEARATALAEGLGAQVEGSFKRVALLKFDEGADLTALVATLEGDTDVEYAELNYINKIDDPTDPGGDPVTTPPVSEDDEDSENKKKAKRQPTFANDLFNTWGSISSSQFMIWADTTASKNVCLIDTGVDLKHPDLAGRVINGYDFVNDDPVANDDNGHGTFLAGIIAAKANNNIGIVGISTGKVVAVKALSAEGSGSNFDIAQAIYYCNSRRDVSVINMSLGHYLNPGYTQSRVMYNALVDSMWSERLVVAAAGNWAYGEPLFFPAAWAVSSTLSAYDGANSIYRNLISVGAIAGPSPYDLWVDANGDRVKDYDEVFGFYDNCSTSWSNYGPWVEIVAPGEDLYSTMPANGPFYMNYYEGIEPGYTYLSGTSFSAAYVSGAAARLWGSRPGTAAETHDRLYDWAEIVNGTNDGFDFYGTDGYDTFQPGWGYDQYFDFDTYPRMTWDISEQTVTYGQPFDYDQDGWTDTVLAPYCWPGDSHPFYDTYGMPTTRVLNIAANMGRYAIILNVKDATTGLPLTGATVKAATTGHSSTAYMDSISSSYAYLLNMRRNAPYTYTVNMPGYTKGAQPVMQGVYISQPGILYEKGIGVPQTGKTTVVTVYNGYRGPYPYWVHTVLFTPGGAVGPYSGALYDVPNYYYDNGGLNDDPWARYNINESESMESITIQNYPGLKAPMYDGDHWIFLEGEWGEDLRNAGPEVTVWQGGVVKYSKPYTSSFNSSCSGPDNHWWKVASIWVSWSTVYYNSYTGTPCQPGATPFWPY